MFLEVSLQNWEKKDFIGKINISFPPPLILKNNFLQLNIHPWPLFKFTFKPIDIIGKTTWAKNYAAAHPEKKFEIINAALYLEKATVNGDSRKNHTDVRFLKSPF